MSRDQENTSFVCENCGCNVLPLTNGSYRNHCPVCLFSKHVDQKPGDRQHSCRGMMKPIGLHYHSKKGWQIIHQCLRCGQQRVNKIAEKTEQPDQIEALIQLFKTSI